MKTLFCASCTSLLLMLMIASAAPVRADGGLHPRAVAVLEPAQEAACRIGALRTLATKARADVCSEPTLTSSSLLYLFALLDAPASGSPS